ncbi:uncharacterized protein ARMOST_11911 [Armillaria ostoyae]|uniref:Uncharacterized protein n=1 Tax=Armillaria ostoyae TaxID=47428 RepID=A0A284RIF3_ARMOS|nr:uncharacterized protein ARMOST_11911 [Armillaria ostoyae]
MYYATSRILNIATAKGENIP